jgi:hypothetical protein
MVAERIFVIEKVIPNCEMHFPARAMEDLASE